MKAMVTTFARSLRALDADGFSRSFWGILSIAILIGAWFVWFSSARVSRYEFSDRARLEVAHSPDAVQATVAGRVVASSLVLSRPVHTGDVLVELDSNPQRLQLQQELTRLSGMESQIAALRDQEAAEQHARGIEQQASHAAIDQARADVRSAEATAAFTESESRRLAALHSEGLIAEQDFARRKAEAQSTRAAAEGLQLALTRLDRDQRTRESEREINVNKIRVQISELEANKGVSRAEVQRLRYEIERRRIVATAAGYLGDVAIVKEGAVVSEGQRLGVIVPPGDVKVSAEFLPQAAGRIRPGQTARLRLTGFPWAQYGTLRATVAQVGNEIRDGRIRVELSLDTISQSRIPVQHGLPGTLEVEVERVSPAALVLRAAGQWITAARNASADQVP
jgi:membrane fusion protein (multidrug efflux system)